MMGCVFRERLDKASPIPTHSTPTRRSLSVVVVLLNLGSLKRRSKGLTGYVVSASAGRARATMFGAGPRHCGESRGSGLASRGRADILGSGEWPGGPSRGPRTPGKLRIWPRVRENAYLAAQLCLSLRCATRKAAHTREWLQPSDREGADGGAGAPGARLRDGPGAAPST